MFWKQIKSKEYIELLEKINLLSVKITSLEIDLELYVRKLKASKGLKKLEEEISEDLNNPVLLTEDGKPTGPSRIGPSRRNR